MTSIQKFPAEYIFAYLMRTRGNSSYWMAVHLYLFPSELNKDILCSDLIQKGQDYLLELINQNTEKKLTLPEIPKRSRAKARKRILNEFFTDLRNQIGDALEVPPIPE